MPLDVKIVADSDFDVAAGDTSGLTHQIPSYWLFLQFWQRRLALESMTRWLPSAVFGAFFQPPTQIFLRRQLYGGSFVNDSAHAISLGHEVEHMFQQDIVAALPPDLSISIDRGLAHRMILEGDAEVTAVVANLARYQAPLLAPAIATATFTQAPPSADLLIGLIVSSYFEGARFALRLVKAAGSLRVLDGALTEPPESTEQVLHVEKFRARELPVTVPSPPLPDVELTHVARDTAGELLLRVVLAQCGGQAAAAGWGGDRFLIGQRHDGELTLAWLLAWDDEAAAARFMATMHDSRACFWQATHAPSFDFVREGRLVALTAGLPPAANRIWLQQTLEAAHARVGEPPPAARAPHPASEEE